MDLWSSLWRFRGNLTTFRGSNVGLHKKRRRTCLWMSLWEYSEWGGALCTMACLMHKMCIQSIWQLWRWWFAAAYVSVCLCSLNQISVSSRCTWISPELDDKSYKTLKDAMILHYMITRCTTFVRLPVVLFNKGMLHYPIQEKPLCVACLWSSNEILEKNLAGEIALKKLFLYLFARLRMWGSFSRNGNMTLK